MRILDRLATAGASFGPQAFRLDRTLPSRRDALAVCGCGLRYVLSVDASQQCGELVRSEPELLRADNPLLRLPASSFWIEWHADEAAGLDRQKLGALVEVDDTGRTGTIRCYWADARGDTGAVPGTLNFDLDNPTLPLPRGSFRLEHVDLPHLNPILSHAQLQLDEGWLAFARGQSAHSVRDLVAYQASTLWFVLPFVLSFAAMLNSEAVVDQRPSDLRELNASRRARHKRPLLDHIEVSMRFGNHGAGHASDGDGSRATPRLHFVRGHLVSRGGKTFWRTAHLRGTGEAPPVTRTVRVNAGAGAALKWSA